MAELIFKKAGHIKLVRRSDSKVFQATGLVQSIQSNMNRNSQAVPDGNNAFDYTYSNGATATITVNLTSWNPTFWGAVASATTATGQTANIPKYEEITVPSTGPYTVTLKATPAASTIAIVDVNNTNYVSNASPTTTGQYNLATNTITFASADAGKKLFVTYAVSSTTATQITVSGQENISVFELTVIGECVLQSDEGTAKGDAIIFDGVMPLGDLNMPQRQKQPGAEYSVTFTLQPPRAGNQAVTYIVEE